jgi:outer membrane immunogenic protein
LAQSPGGLAGFYIGGNVGYSWGHLPVSVFTSGFNTGTPLFQNIPGSAASTKLHLNGYVAGGQVGYNWYISQGWLAGIEADLQTTGEKAGFSTRFAGSNPFCFFTSLSCSYSNQTDLTAKLSWFGTLRGRVGPEINGLWFYGTGGLAFGRITASGSNAFKFVSEGFLPSELISNSAFGFSTTKVGWTLGAGVESRIGTTNWSWKFEYIHIDLGTIGDIAFGSVPYVTVSLGRFTDDILRFGLNYGFRP